MDMNTDSISTRGFRPGPFSPFERVAPGLTSPEPERFPRPAKERLRARAAAGGVDPAAGSRPSRVSSSPAARAGTTVTQASLGQYLRKGEQLFDRFLREGDARAEEVTALEWVTWLLSRKPTLQSSSWRVYRQSAIHFLDGFAGERDAALALMDNDIIDSSRTPAAPKPGASKRTSAKRERRLPIDDFEAIAASLQFNRSRLAPVVVDWLRAGILTGLRPTEWRATDIEVQPASGAPHGRSVWLYVLSAKATNGRGTGVVRTLDISIFSDKDLGCVRRMSDRGRAWLESGTYGAVQAHCAKVLYSTTAKLWPKRARPYTLYSCRHQAIANWKAILKPEEIAAIVGHGVTATAAENYGKRRSAWAVEHIPVPPMPVVEELRQVRKTMRLFDLRFDLERRAGLRRGGDIPAYPVG